MERKCSKCKVVKCIQKFHSGAHWCKKCKKEYDRVDRKTYRENNIELKKKYYIDNKEKIKERLRRYRHDNIETLLYRSAMNRAIKKGIDFSISIDDVNMVMCDICPLLGIKMVINDNVHRDNSLSIDRIDSSKGYIPNNIWVISYKANLSKNNATIDEYSMLVNNFNKLRIVNGNCFDIDLRNMFYNAKRRAKKNNFEFNINLEYLNKIYPKNGKCQLLGIDLKKQNDRFKHCSPSLDRIDPNLGYIRGNVMIISYRANCIKSNLMISEMSKLVENWKLRLQQSK